MTEPTTIKEVYQLLNQCPIFLLKEAVEEIIEHIDEFEEDENDFCASPYVRNKYYNNQRDLILCILSCGPFLPYEKLSVETKDKMHLILKSYNFCNALSKS